MRQAVMVQMTWPGAPTIYYGDEAGVCGFTDPDNRRTYPWGHEDKELIDFHKKMIAIHKKCPEFKTGSIMVLGEDYGYIAYGRFVKEGQSAILVNNSDQEITKEVSMWTLGMKKDATVKRIMLTTEEGFDDSKVEYQLEGGKLTVTLPKHSAAIFRHKGALKIADDSLSQ